MLGINHHSQRLKLKTLQYIETRILYSLFINIGKYDMKKIREIEKIEKLKE